MTDHNLPEHEWEFSHALETGDVLVDPARDERGEVTVHDDGSVTFRGDRFTENQIRVSLRDSVLERDDGLSHELATY